MKKLIYTAIAIAIQHSFAQTPNDNIGSGNCLSFNGNGNRVDVGQQAVLRPTNALSISVWVYANDLTVPGSVRGIVTNEWPDATLTGYALSMNAGGSVRFTTGDGSATSNSISATISSGEWTHIACTFDGNVKNMYKNGVLVSSSAWNTNISYADNVMLFRIGREYNNQNNRSWNGKLDEVSVWSKALTQAEVKDNMCTQLVGNESGLIGYWNMNSGTGNSVTDLTANNNNGTMY